jgi:hypothetical protein
MRGDAPISNFLPSISLLIPTSPYPLNLIGRQCPSGENWPRKNAQVPGTYVDGPCEARSEIVDYIEIF